MKRKLENYILARAKKILEKRLSRARITVDNLAVASNFFVSKLGDKKRETFAVMFLDSRSRLIGYKELFLGSIRNVPVYPREILRAVMDRNAATVILAHNHPSLDPEPSENDKDITTKIVKLLEHIDVQVLDHIVVGGHQAYSFKENDLL